MSSHSCDKCVELQRRIDVLEGELLAVQLLAKQECLAPQEPVEEISKLLYVQIADEDSPQVFRWHCPEGETNEQTISNVKKEYAVHHPNCVIQRVMILEAK